MSLRTLHPEDFPTRDFLLEILARPPRELSTLTRVVCDTNLILDWLYWENAPEKPLLAALSEQRFAALASPATFLELADVLTRPAFGLSVAEQGGILARWADLSYCLPDPGEAILRTRDPDDQKFLNLACGRNAHWLLTKDKDLLSCAKKARRCALTICQPIRFPLESLPQ